MAHVNIQLGMNAGGLISSAAAARRAIQDLEKEIETAQKAGDEAKVGKLYLAKERLSASSNGFDRDFQKMTQDPQYQRIMDKQAAGQTLTKHEEAYISSIDTLKDALKKNTDALLEAVKSGDTGAIWKHTSDVSQNMSDFHKLTDKETSPAKPQGAKEMVNAIGLGQVASALNDGFARWVSSLDRSGIINQYGSGDIMGGRISEKRRQADFWGGIAQSGLGLAGAGIGFFVGGPAAAAAGAMAGTEAGKAINTAMHAPVNKEASEAAFAGLWQSRSGDAMELAALLGRLGGSAEENTRNLRDAFDMAASAAAEFGYSAEEGMDVMKQAAQQGLGGEEAGAIAKEVFSFERGTGADRGTLMGISTMSARYGAGDALGTGWQGLQASGMKSGQYGEYLRAMQRVMEEGISKGFVRSSEQAAQNLTMLSQMTGNNPLWQGENGARRLSEMNAGLENTKSLQSTTDVMAYRAAQNAMKTEGIEAKGYHDALAYIEKGINPTFFKEWMKLTSKSEGGNRDEVLSRMVKTFGMKSISAIELHDGYNPNKDYTQAELDNYTRKPPSAESKELDAARTIEAIKNELAMAGRDYWDKQLPKLYEEFRKAKEEKPKSAAELSNQRMNDLMGGMRDMPVFNTSGISGLSFDDTIEKARLAPADTALHQAYQGLQGHFAGLPGEDYTNAAKSGYYPSVWLDSGGDLVKMWDIIQRRGNVKPVDADAALKGFFDKRGDKGSGSSFWHYGDNDSTARDRLRDLESNTRIDSPDYGFLQKAYSQLAEFDEHQRETVDRNNSLNEILKSAQTAQKLYDAVVELARQMNVRVVYEEP